MAPSSEHLSEVLGQMKRLVAEFEQNPLPRVIVADHRVPYGRALRQWNTAGELMLWVNRGEVEDLPRKEATPGGVFEGIPFGIPVFHVHPDWVD